MGAVVLERLPTKLYAGRKSADFARYRAEVAAAMKKPGHANAFSHTTHLQYDAPAAAPSSVTTPTLVIKGETQPDFPDPPVEAQWVADQLKGTVRMVPESGHYPQAQRPDPFSLAVEAFADEVHRRA